MLTNILLHSLLFGFFLTVIKIHHGWHKANPNRSPPLHADIGVQLALCARQIRLEEGCKWWPELGKGHRICVIERKGLPLSCTVLLWIGHSYVLDRIVDISSKLESKTDLFPRRKRVSNSVSSCFEGSVWGVLSSFMTSWYVIYYCCMNGVRCRSFWGTHQFIILYIN